MDAAQRLISGETKQLFQSVLLSQGAFKPVDVVAQQYVQLLHDTNHWVTSALLDGQVCFADSLGQYPTPSVQKQLKEIYQHKLDSNAKLHVTVLPVETQMNGHDCGPHAIANAFALASGMNPAYCTYDKTQLRTHLLLCLESAALLPFPCLPHNKKGRPRKAKVVLI